MKNTKMCVGGWGVEIKLAFNMKIENLWVWVWLRQLNGHVNWNSGHWVEIHPGSGASPSRGTTYAPTSNLT